MKAFLAALVVVVVIAVAAHLGFQQIAPDWNAAAVGSVPQSVRLAPSDMPEIGVRLQPVILPSGEENKRSFEAGTLACARFRASHLFSDPSGRIGQAPAGVACAKVSVRPPEDAVR